MNAQPQTFANPVPLPQPPTKVVEPWDNSQDLYENVPQPNAVGEFASPADGAKFMASLGVPQVPLSTPTDKRWPNPGKNPAINGTGWQDKASTDFAQIDAWAKKFHGCNFGSLAKAQADGFYVMETDSTELAEKYEKETGRTFQAQLVIESSAPRRNHRWYRHSEVSLAQLRNIGQEDAAGFSLRQHNEQCVSPGSIHATGKQYRIVRYHAPAPAEQPAEELRWMLAQKPKSVAHAAQPNGQKTLIPPGGHHTALLREVGFWIGRGYSKDATYQAVVDWGYDNLESPGHGDDTLEAHVRKMVDSTDDWDRGNPGADFATTQNPYAESGTGPTTQDEQTSEPQIVEEPLPEFPAMTGSLADLAKALFPDLPYCLKFMAAMTIVGSLLAGKVYIRGARHVEPRFYTVMIDEKGAGKGGAVAEVRSALSALISAYLNITPSINSGPALVLELAKHPRTMWYADELDKVFENAKASGSAGNSLFAELLTMHDGNETGNNAKTNFQLPAEVRDKVCPGGSCDMKVSNARFSLLGGVQPDVFATMWRGVKGGANGLQSRFTIVSSGNTSVPEPQKPSDEAAVQHAVERISEQVTRYTTNGTPTVLTLPDELGERLRAWWKEVSPLHKKASTRTPAMLMRLLIILCVANGFSEVTPELVEQAIAYGNYQITLTERFMPSDAMTWDAAYEELILRAFRKHGKTGLTLNKVRRYVNPEQHQLLGGFGPFLKAWNNLKNTGVVVVIGHTVRQTPIFGLSDTEPT